MKREENDRKQKQIFEILSGQVDELLGRFGKSDSLLGPGDYSVYGSYWGHPQVKITISNLELLRPDIVKRMQEIVRDFPGWELVVAVAVPSHYDDWPDMGLYIRSREIIDGLQRKYLPKGFQNVEYEGSRPGTEKD
jgi:hypothetical protein